MKKPIFIVLILFSCLGFAFTVSNERTVKLGSVGVSFAKNSLIELRYFEDVEKTVPIDTSKRHILEEGSSIYIQYQVINKPRFTLKGFKISEYSTSGKRIDTNRISENLESIVIPEGIFSGEISIEPIAESDMRLIGLSDSADGVELKGNWTIHDVSYRSPSAAINPFISYDVSYKYDATKYYYISAEPAKKIISLSDGMVLFYAENPETDSMGSLTSEYSVKLKPFTFLSLHNTKPIISIIGPEGNTLKAENISSYPFRGGDTITITTKKDYQIDCKGAVVNLIQLVEDSRTFTLTIPEDSIDYALNVSAITQKTKNVAIELPLLGKNEEKPKITITINEDSFSYDQLIKMKDVTMSEGDILYIGFEKTPNNKRIYLTIEGEDLSHTPSKHEIVDAKSFQYTYSAISAIRIDVEEGYRFSDTIDNDERLKVTYVADGKTIKNGQFLASGTVVHIYIICPEGLKAKGKFVKAGANKGSFVINNSTKRQDFIVHVEEAAGFYFDPSEYKYKHGSIVFTLDGEEINSRKFIANGKKIAYEAEVTSVEAGFRLPEKIEGNTILVDGEYNTIRLLKEIEFVPASRVTVYLTQPEYGGSITYSYKGEEILGDSIDGYVGDTISIEYKSWDWWDPNGFNKKTYILTPNANQSVPLPQDVFVEREANKPELTIFIAKGVEDAFTVDLSDLEIAYPKPILKYEKTARDNRKIEKTDFCKDMGKIRTHKPLKITINGYTLPSINEAIKIESRVLDKDNTEKAAFAYIQQPNYTFIYNDLEKAARIYVRFEKVFVDKFRPKLMTYATVNVYRETGEFLNNSEELIELDSKVSVKIIPDTNYYLVGKGVKNDLYEKEMTYSSYLENIDSIISNLSIKKYYSLYLKQYDNHGIYRYTLNKKEVTTPKISFKEGDVLSLWYELTDDLYRIDSLLSKLPGMGKSSSGKIKLTPDYDNEEISRTSLDIKIVRSK
jgi:hypothetical protein